MGAGASRKLASLDTTAIAGGCIGVKFYNSAGDQVTDLSGYKYALFLPDRLKPTTEQLSMAAALLHYSVQSTDEVNLFNTQETTNGIPNLYHKYGMIGLADNMAAVPDPCAHLQMYYRGKNVTTAPTKRALLIHPLITPSESMLVYQSEMLDTYFIYGATALREMDFNDMYTGLKGHVGSKFPIQPATRLADTVKLESSLNAGLNESTAPALVNTESFHSSMAKARHMRNVQRDANGNALF